MQVKLLRALQERRVRKIGASREEAVDVRVMCASHKDLAAMVSTDQFRQDLYYRLNVLALRMPTLRERTGDIPVLARAILEHLAVRYGDPRPRRLSQAALERLVAYPFPGNVRELENLLERAYAFAETEDIQVADLGPLDANMVERAALRPAPSPLTPYTPWAGMVPAESAPVPVPIPAPAPLAAAVPEPEASAPAAELPDPQSARAVAWCSPSTCRPGLKTWSARSSSRHWHRLASTAPPPRRCWD